MLSAPFKGCTQANITQTYWDGHRALDICKFNSTSGYGTPLTAPEDVKILSITGDKLTEGNHALEHGYGIFMKGLETGMTHLYWHTLPILPVNKGDVVKRGKIVAYMGNAGKVMVNDMYIPLEERTKAPFNGTHLHYELFDSSYVLGKSKKFVNPLAFIDFTLQPEYSYVEYLTSVVKVMQKRLLITQRQNP